MTEDSGATPAGDAGAADVTDAAGSLAGTGVGLGAGTDYAHPAAAATLPPTPRVPAESVGGAFAARVLLIIGGVISVLIIGVGILLAATASGDAALGGFVVGVMSPFVAVVVMGLFSCVALICAIRADSRRLVMASIGFIVLAILVFGVLFALIAGRS